jgi:hypothetical protein
MQSCLINLVQGTGAALACALLSQSLEEIMKRLSVAAVLGLGITAVLSGPASAQSNVKAGLLKCLVSGGAGFIFGSTKELECKYEGSDGGRESYRGEISKYGIDIGTTGKGVMYWTVLAPTAELGKRALAGTYGGVSASAAVGYGAGANALVGGSGKTVVLQPLSGQVEEGLNLAVGVAEIKLY